MEYLQVKYRFQNLPFIVADGKGVFYQLPHCSNRYSKPFRILKPILNNGVTEGIRFNRKFISFKQLREKAYEAHELIHLENKHGDVPF